MRQLAARSSSLALHPATVLPKPSLDTPELYGVEPSYAMIHSLRLAEGRFFDEGDDAASVAVCVLGETAKVSILGFGPAVGKFIKINTNYEKIVVGIARLQETRKQV